MRWRRSTHSNTQGANCVEIGQYGEMVYIRDSRNRPGPVIAITQDDWTHLLNALHSLG
ncbi:DUF397 domain-containing protein [Actinomadura formosensis]|uniref:DUF397 domain-containing protein n=1 Tax=Actinomadura formosensis TaxID=60706 RepID=UPI001F5FE4FD|nr:DUF397 domain-containing protein [Actinomadura formosensis]